jgi:hypothetical protein
MNPIDDHAARDLLGPLAGEPEGAQRLDLEKIIRGGDRRRRTRHVATGVLSAAAVVVLVGAAAAVTRDHRLTAGVPTAGDGAATPYPTASSAPDGAPASQPPPPLPSAAMGPACPLSPIGGGTGYVLAVDHTGHYTLEERGNPGQKAVARTAVVRRDGRQVAAVALPPSARNEYALNAKGDFVATIADIEKNGTPYAYVGGKLTRLKGGSGVVRGITDGGRIGGLVGATDRPVYWENATAKPTDLRLPPGATRGGVIGIEEDGTVAGEVFTADMDATAVVWLPGGAMKTIPVPAIQNPPYLVGIRDGWVAGGTSQNGFRYRIDTGRYEVLRAQGSNPQVMGGNGSVVAAPGANTLYVLSGTTARQLTTEPDPALVSYSITGVSDDGRTVTGNSFTKITGDDSEIQAVRWTCS